MLLLRYPPATQMRGRMYKIGDFATLSRVSAKMLRHYAALGLLTPAHVDPATGYRYYTAEQLPRLNRIIVLKDLGFALEEIAGLLDADVPLAQLHDALGRRRAEVAQRIADERRRLVELDRRLSLLAAQRAAHEVLLRPVPPAPVAAAALLVSTERELTEALNAVEGYVDGLRARAPRPATVIFHECTARTMRVEVAVPLAAPIAGASWVRPATLPGAPLMACVVHTGADEGLADACAALHQWIDDHGYRAAGPYRERYLRYSSAGPLQLPPAFVAPDPAAAVTELQVPVVPAHAA
jgi:DNA-binding transcriptional MerR regulator